MRTVFTSFSLVLALVGATSGCKLFTKGSKVNQYNKSATTWRDPQDHPSGVMHVVDGGGRSGSDGADGEPGEDRNTFLDTSGRLGGNGDDGTPGEHATSSGDIDVMLSYAGNTAKFSIVGEVKKGGRTVERVSYPGDVASSGYVLLNGNGGEGGKGGDGGRGGQGGRGSKAHDLEDENDSSIGGQGGRGGNGGDGKRGGDGGSGGRVTVHVPHDQTELLWMVRAQSFGGPGGDKGNAGAPGEGGPGGEPGKSFPYEVTEKYTEQDENGNTVEKEKTVQKSNSNSSYGPQGFDGTAGGTASRGDDGKDGLRQIKVTGGSAEAVYDKMFELELSDVQLEHQFDDGVLEPGEIFHVRQFTFQNVEKMPTPPKKTTFTLIPQGDLKVANQTGEITEVSENGIPGKSAQSWNAETNKYTFRVNEFKPGELPKPEEFQFYPGVVVGGKSMNLELGKRFEVKAPGKVFDENPEVKNLVVLGQSTKSKVLRVRNVSTVPYGPDSTMKRSFKLVLRHREVTHKNGLGEDVAPVKAKDVMLNFATPVARGGSTKPVTMDTEIIIDVPRLEPGADLEIPFTVFLSDQVGMPGAHFGIEMELYVSPDINQPPTKLIDKNMLTFMSSMDPKTTFDAHILIFNRALSCSFRNHSKKHKMIDELWIQKAYDPNKVSPPPDRCDTAPRQVHVGASTGGPP
jgi:hypothetical protein